MASVTEEDPILLLIRIHDYVIMCYGILMSYYWSYMNRQSDETLHENFVKILCSWNKLIGGLEEILKL